MRRRGFTLLEVTLVMAVTALAATIVLPRLVDATRAPVDVAARRLTDALAFGRARAILTGTPMRLVLDLDRRRWALGRPGRAPGSIELADVPAPPLGPPTALPDGVAVRRIVTGDTASAPTGMVVVDLAPDGDPLPVRIELADDAGHAATVLVPPALARPSIGAGGRS